MICKNCGAQIDENLLECPYCGTENKEVAKRQQEEYIDGYERKKEDLNKLPEIAARRATKKVPIVIAVIVVLFLAVFLCTWLFGRDSAGDTLEKQKEQIAKLEEYYQAGQYEEMYDYLNELEHSYSATYEKYRIVGSAYHNLKYDIESLKSFRSYVMFEDDMRDMMVRDLKSILSSVFRDMAEIKKLEENDFVYGEGDVIQNVYEKYRSALSYYLLMPDVMIETAVIEYDDMDTDYSELAKDILDMLEDSDS